MSLKVTTTISGWLANISSNTAVSAPRKRPATAKKERWHEATGEQHNPMVMPEERLPYANHIPSAHKRGQNQNQNNEFPKTGILQLDDESPGSSWRECRPWRSRCRGDQQTIRSPGSHLQPQKRTIRTEHSRSIASPITESPQAQHSKSPRSHVGTTPTYPPSPFLGWRCILIIP